MTSQNVPARKIANIKFTPIAGGRLGQLPETQLLLKIRRDKFTESLKSRFYAE